MGVQITPPERAVRQLGYNLVNMQQYERAVAVFKHNVKHHPQSVDALWGLGYGYEVQGNIQQALIKIEAALNVVDTTYPYLDALKETKSRLQIQLNKMQ
jgi:tetratricopeptide (TPR) repeat protein